MNDEVEERKRIKEIKMVVVCHRTQVYTSDCECEPELNTSTRSSFGEKKITKRKRAKERLNGEKQKKQKKDDVIVL